MIKTLSSVFIWKMFFAFLLWRFLESMDPQPVQFDTQAQVAIYGILMGCVCAWVSTIPAKIMASLFRYISKKPQ